VGDPFRGAGGKDRERLSAQLCGARVRDAQSPLNE
jgi:hypothetical protein